MFLKQRGLAADFVTPVFVGSQANVVAALLSGQQQNGIVITRIE